MEETRKLIKFGESSFVVSLPRNWVKKNNLNKGDSLALEENGNGELVLYPHTHDKKDESKEITIEVTDKNFLHIQRELMVSYINNYNIIKFHGKLKKEDREEIVKLVNNLLALQIIEESSTQIVIKDFLNLKDISIKDIIRRMDFVIRAILENCIETINQDKYETIAQIDATINKFMYLMYRIVKNVLNNKSNIKSLNISMPSLLTSWILVNNIEHISDECRRFARFLKTANLKEKEKREFTILLKEIQGMYFDVMKAYYTNNKELVHSVLDKKFQIIEMCKKTFSNCTSKNCGPSIEKIKGMASSIRDIGRAVVVEE